MVAVAARRHRVDETVEAESPDDRPHDRLERFARGGRSKQRLKDQRSESSTCLDIRLAGHDVLQHVSFPPNDGGAERPADRSVQSAWQADAIGADSRLPADGQSYIRAPVSAKRVGRDIYFGKFATPSTRSPGRIPRSANQPFRISSA